MSFNYKQPVFIPYEIKNREQDGRILLISYLLNAGYRKIFLGSRDGLKREALKYKNGVYFLKSLSKTEEIFYKKLKELNFTIVLLHVEGGILYEDSKSDVLSFFGPELIKYLDFNFVFGEALKNDIGKYCGLEFMHNTIVSGEPRFDLLKPKYHSFFKKNIDIIQSKYNNFILINTNFGVANPIVGKSFLLKTWEAEPSYSADTVRLLKMKMDFLDGVLNDYIIAIHKLADEFQNINFIIRPHPSEAEEKYKFAFNKHKNIFVNKSGNVAQWIMASKGVIHYDCTTGMEAVIVGRPTISFLPKWDKEILAWLPVAVSKQSSTINELVSDVRKIIDGTFNFTLDQKILAEWSKYINNVKEEASDIIVRNIDSVKSSDNTNITPRIHFLINKFFDFISCGKASLKLVYKTLLRRKQSISEQKFGKLKVKEVLNKIELINKINNFSNKVDLVKKESSVIQITKL